MSIDQQLIDLFAPLSTEILPTGTLLYRGDWTRSEQPSVYPMGPVWFHLTLRAGAGYVNSWSDHGHKHGKTPVVFVVRSNQDLRLLRYKGDHIKDLTEILGVDDFHALLRQRLPTPLRALPQGPVDGFFIEFEKERVEYFVLRAAEVLTEQTHLVGQAALDEGELAKQ